MNVTEATKADINQLKSLQSSLSKRAWSITKEEAFKRFYREHGRMKEMRAAKAHLEILHDEQVVEKRMLKRLNFGVSLFNDFPMGL